MSKRKIETSHAPQAIGPYSQAVLAPPFLFISGQIPLNPHTGKVEETTIEGQTKQVLSNLDALLKEAGLSFEDVVKSEIFLKDLNDFQVVNTLYGEKFSGPILPARFTVQVAKLPLDVKIEIACVAYTSSS